MILGRMILGMPGEGSIDIFMAADVYGQYAVAFDKEL
jgi:hypothetical protein